MRRSKLRVMRYNPVPRIADIQATLVRMSDALRKVHAGYKPEKAYSSPLGMSIHSLDNAIMYLVTHLRRGSK